MPTLLDIGDLALETRTGHGLPSPRRTAPSRRLTGKPLTAHDPKDLGEPDHRAGTPPCPNTEIVSATRQFLPQRRLIAPTEAARLAGCAEGSIFPQVYWNIGFTAADYAVLVPWWSDVVAGTRVQLYIGEALYKVGVAGQPAPWQDPAELSRHLDFCAEHPEVRGNVYFSATQVAADPLGAMSRVVADHYPTRARTP